MHRNQSTLVSPKLNPTKLSLQRRFKPSNCNSPPAILKTVPQSCYMSRTAASGGIFQAIADSTRQAILDSLQKIREQPVKQLAEPFAMSKKRYLNTCKSFVKSA
jgi:hypothetical protein